MLTTSPQYVLFAGGAFVLYWAVTAVTKRPRCQNVVLLGLSYAFYAYWDWRAVPLLLGNSLVAYGGALLVGRGGRRHDKLILTGVVAVNLASLAVFKYYGFFAEQLAGSLDLLGLHTDIGVLSLLLPLGISYYSFQNVSYVIDVHRGDMRATGNVLTYCTAVSFFAQLVAGPITRPRALLPQLATQRRFDAELAADGLRQFLWGLLKKALIADNMVAHVNAAFAAPQHWQGGTLALTAVLFSFQIYFDFSGYTDMALGVGKLFGLRLAPNFDQPYFARSVAEFWRCWHMSLSSWMRDYVYIPLGGNRRSLPRNVLNTLITFLLVGLWHGASWNYIFWGLLNGMYLVPRTVRRKQALGKSPEAGSEGRRQWLRVAAVFALVTLAWIFFRSPTLVVAWEYLIGIVSSPLGLRGAASLVPLLALGAGALAVEYAARRWEHPLAACIRLRVPLRWSLYVALVLVFLVFADLGSRAFMYVTF